MKRWGFRIGRATFLAVLAWGLFRVLDGRGHGALFLPIVGVVFLLWVAEQLRGRHVRRKKERDWDRWEASVLDEEGRGTALAEVRAALARSLRFGPRLKQEQAHLSVILAELLDASDQSAEAARVLARVDLAALPPGQAVVVRHAKAVAYLEAGLLDDAEATLAVRDLESGVPDMDARLDLLGGLLEVERGRPERALEIVSKVEAKAADPAIKDECVVLRAIADDARGARDEATAGLRALDPDTLEVLRRVGPRRVRSLAQSA